MLHEIPLSAKYVCFYVYMYVRMYVCVVGVCLRIVMHVCAYFNMLVYRCLLHGETNL